MARVLQGRPGECALHSLSQSQKKLFDLALPTFPAVCRLRATAHLRLSLLSRLQYQGQWSHGPPHNSVKQWCRVATSLSHVAVLL